MSDAHSRAAEQQEAIDHLNNQIRTNKTAHNLAYLIQQHKQVLKGVPLLYDSMELMKSYLQGLEEILLRECSVSKSDVSAFELERIIEHTEFSPSNSKD